MVPAMCGHPRQISDERGFTMIAKHNIKVNGKWYHTGEEVPETGKQAKVAPAQQEMEQVIESVPETKDAEAPKPRSASRRKVSK